MDTKPRQKRLRLIQGEYLLSLESCTVKCDIGKTKLMEMVSNGEFPQPVAGLKALGLMRWRGQEVDSRIVEWSTSLEADVKLRSVGGTK